MAVFLPAPERSVLLHVSTGAEQKRRQRPPQ